MHVGTELGGADALLPFPVLAQAPDLVDADAWRLVAPAGADEVDHVGDLLVVHPPAERRHGEARRCLVGGRQGAALEHDVHQGGRVAAGHYRVAGQGREDPRIALAVGAVAGPAVVDVERRAGLAVVAVEQCLGYALVVDVRLVGGVRRRQRLEVAGDGGEVGVGHVLHAVHHHVGHAAEHRAALAAAGTQEADQVGFAPAAQSGPVVAAQALGDPVLQRRAAGQVGRAIARRQGLLLHAQPTRGMAGATVAKAFDQVGAARQHRVLPGGGLEVLHLGSEGPAPECQRPAHRQRPRDVAGLVGLLHRLHAMHEVGVEGAHVRFADSRVGRVGHRRVERVAGPGHAVAHGTVEVLEAVVADAGLAVRGDVGRVHRADRRFHRQAPGERLAVPGGVAGHAIAGAGQVFTLPDQGRVRRCGGLGDAAGEGGEGEEGCRFHRCAPHACTSGPGFFRYCSRIALADQ